MKRLFQISRYPGLLIFLLAAISVVIVAFLTYNLLHMGMANLHFIQQHGWLALRSGGLMQLIQILAYGVVSLFFFIVFKVCESELVIRYRRWQDR